jgi:hypothetical protein
MPHPDDVAEVVVGTLPQPPAAEAAPVDAAAAPHPLPPSLGAAMSAAPHPVASAVASGAAAAAGATAGSAATPPWVVIHAGWVAARPRPRPCAGAAAGARAGAALFASAKAPACESGARPCPRLAGLAADAAGPAPHPPALAAASPEAAATLLPQPPALPAAAAAGAEVDAAEEAVPFVIQAGITLVRPRPRPAGAAGAAADAPQPPALPAAAAAGAEVDAAEEAVPFVIQAGITLVRPRPRPAGAVDAAADAPQPPALVAASPEDGAGTPPQPPAVASGAPDAGGEVLSVARGSAAARAGRDAVAVAGTAGIALFVTGGEGGSDTELAVCASAGGGDAESTSVVAGEEVAVSIFCLKALCALRKTMRGRIVSMPSSSASSLVISASVNSWSFTYPARARVCVRSRAMRSGIAAGWSHTERGRNRERRTLFFERFVEFVGHVEGLRDLIIFEDRVEPLSELDHLGRVAPSCLKLPQLRMATALGLWMG